MKFLSSLLLFLSFLTCSFAQDYIPIIEQNKHYFVTSIQSAGWYNGYIGYVMRGDTLVENLIYTKVYRQVFAEQVGDFSDYEPPYELRYELLFALMREDINERKIYARIYDENYPIHWWCDENYELGEEILLYDFGQSVGDVMSFCPFLPTSTNTNADLILDSIYLEESWGESRRFFRYSGGEEGRRFYIKEGLGGFEGIFSQFNIALEDEGWYILLNICIDTNEECGIVDFVATKDILPLTNEIKLSPNPTSGQIILYLSETVTEKGLFQITDLTGKVVHSELLKSGNYTRYLDLTKGFYSASFQQKGQTLWQNKLIVLPK
ncbi:MAG: hypothetical protein ACI85O_003421 [Saprospiraceae bacterium]|jgi:hypothetical protein